jgi:hypothetical protein
VPITHSERCRARLSELTNSVPDKIWNEVAKHSEERALAAPIIHIALIDTRNRLNVTNGQVAGQGVTRWVD